VAEALRGRADDRVPGPRDPAARRRPGGGNLRPAGPDRRRPLGHPSAPHGHPAGEPGGGPGGVGAPDRVLHADVVEDAPYSAGGEPGQEVDIAIRAEVGAQGRSEDRQLGDLPLAAERPDLVSGPCEWEIDRRLVRHVLTLAGSSLAG